MKLSHHVLMAGALTLAALAMPRVADATEHIIEMRNKDDAGNLMVFVPGYVKAAPGDTIKFVPTDKGHNTESVTDIWPEGVATVKGAFSKEVTFTTDKDGLYVFKCLPHYGMGMVALVQVGKPVNLDAVKKFAATGKAKQRLDAEVAKVTE